MTTHILIAPLVAIALTQIAVIGTFIYLHRALAHRALVAHPLRTLLSRTRLWLATGQRREEWVVIRRKHHAFSCGVVVAPLKVGDAVPHHTHSLGRRRRTVVGAAEKPMCDDHQ